MPESSPPQKKNCLRVGSSDHAKVLQDEAYEQVRTDLQRMVNQDGCSDVTFICKDGGRVKAIRSLLVGRCNVLKGMLENGMRETSLSEINLSHISSQALLCVFEYLYTGSIMICQPKTWRLQFEVVVAAKYFLLHNLVGIVLELIDETSEVGTDLNEVASMLTVILECNHFRQEDRCYGAKRELVRLLSLNWTHSTYASNLSEEALYYLLSNTKPRKRSDSAAVNNDREIEIQRIGEPSLTEYYRLRQIILWCAYQNVPRWSRQAQEIVESAVPLIKDTLSLRCGAGIGEENADSNSSLGLKSLLDDSSKDSAMRLLSIIDLRYIHLLLLEKVVRPLNLFPSSEIMRVFRFHALDPIMRSTSFSNATCGWKHGPSIAVCGDGSSIENIGCDGGTAIALMKMSSRNIIQLWRFVIEAATISHIIVGFMFINEDQVTGWGESNLNNKTLGRLHKARGGGIYLTKSRLRKGSLVVFRYDFVEHNCSLSVDGKDYGICWENLPELDCYPAVSFGKSEIPRSGLIRIQTPTM